MENLFNTSNKKYGVLCPVFSLPGSFGIGDFSSCREFLDIIADSKLSLWQILPLNITGYLDSPYQALSSFGGDEMYIDLDELTSFYNIDFILERFETDVYIDYLRVKTYKRRIIKDVYNLVKVTILDNSDYNDFLINNKDVVDTAKFLTLKELNNLVSWVDFSVDYDDNNLQHKDLFNYHLFSQYTFDRQWKQIRKLASDKEITILGDLPFYVGHDSADVYFNKEIFWLEDTRMIFKAGVPPDYFSSEGQLWGNPIYRWDIVKDYNYDYWINRLNYSHKLYDVIRLDHFRGFDSYWMVDGNDDNAINGRWERGPRDEFFNILFDRLPDIKLVVEDLGIITEDVTSLRKQFSLLGMEVLQFSLDFEQENILEINDNSKVLYTGTHDNDTLFSYYLGLDPEQKKLLSDYFIKAGFHDDSITNMINLCIAQDVPLVVIPLSDLMYLENYARINTPATMGGTNWKFELSSFKDIESGIKKFFSK